MLKRESIFFLKRIDPDFVFQLDFSKHLNRQMANGHADHSAEKLTIQNTALLNYTTPITKSNVLGKC